MTYKQYLEMHEVALAIMNSYLLGDPQGSLKVSELMNIVAREMPGKIPDLIKHMSDLLDVFHNVTVSTDEDGQKVWKGVVAKPIEFLSESE